LGIATKGPAALVKHFNDKNTVTGKAKTAIKGSTGVAKKSKIKGPSNEQDPTIQDEPREPEAGAAIAGGVAGSARDEFGRAQEANAADWWHLPTRNGAEKEALIRLREARPDIATAPDAGKQVGEGTEHLVEHGPEGTVTKHTKNFGYVLHPTVGPFGGYAELGGSSRPSWASRSF
jgi:hypothetical protein